MAFVPAKRKKKKNSPVQSGSAARGRPLSADRASSSTFEVKPDEVRSKETTTCGEECPGPKETEETPDVPQGPGPYFYIGGSNGAGLVSIYCQRRGWQRIYDNGREDYALKWCETKCRETYNSFKEGEQLLYQIPNNGILTTKIGLLNCLREQERVMNKITWNSNYKLLKMGEFFPESFRLDLRDERNAFFELCQEGDIWICKPTCSNQGRGIFLLKNRAAVTTYQAKLHSTEEDQLSKKGSCKVPQARIVQRYIHQPLLLEGKKFDVRSYLLIACTAPYVLLFAQGYVRLTCTHYDAASDDLTAHLTNQYVQKKNPLYNQLKEETIWRMERFNSYVNEKFRKANGLPKDWVFTVFTKRMQQIMVQCFLAAKLKLERKLGYFDLIGCDFLIDENFKIWLLEMNANPALHTNCKVLRDIIPTIVYESLDLVLEIFNKCLKGQSLLPLETLGHFVLLYKEDAAAPGQIPAKLRISPCMGRYLRPNTSSPSHFCQSPAKTLENSSKKLPSSKEKVGFWRNKHCQRSILAVPHVRLFSQEGKPSERAQRHQPGDWSGFLRTREQRQIMGCCGLRQAGSAGMGQDEVELLRTGASQGRSRKWSISEGQSEGFLHPKDPVALTETQDTEAPWGRTQEELVDLLITQPISGWEGVNIHSLGDIVCSSLVLLRSYRMEEMCECFLVLFSFHLLILSVDHSKKSFVYEGLLPLAGMRMRKVVSAISNTFEIAGSMIESRLICCQNSADLDMWVQHLQHQIEKADATCPSRHNSIISFLVPCDEQWKKRELMRHLSCTTILKWEGRPIQHLGRMQHLAMVQVASGSIGKSEERLLILFPEDLLFLSVDKERTAITYEGKLPISGIQAKRKTAVLGGLQFEITGSLTEPILVICSTAEDYEKCLFHLQKVEKNLDTPTLPPPPIVPKKSRQYPK